MVNFRTEVSMSILIQILGYILLYFTYFYSIPERKFYNKITNT